MTSRGRPDDGVRYSVALVALAQVVVGVLAVPVVRNENWDEAERPIGPQTLVAVLGGDLGNRIDDDERGAFIAAALLLFAVAGFVLAFVVTCIRGRRVWSGLQGFAAVCYVVTGLVLLATTLGDTERSELVAMPGMAVLVLPLLLPVLGDWLFRDADRGDESPGVPDR